LSDIPDYIENICLKLPYVVESFTQELKIYNDRKFDLYISTSFDLSNWDHTFSARDYSEQFKKNIEIKNLGQYKISIEKDQYIDGFCFRFNKNELDIPIGKFITKFNTVFNDVHQLTINKLQNTSSQNTLFSYFNFPEDIKYPCSQYLLYFASFLRDLGIKVKTELNDEFEKILFKITPEDKNVALFKIKEALDLYLNFPMASSDSLVNNSDNEINVYKLISNIRFLQSQVEMSKAIIESKNTTIEFLKNSPVVGNISFPCKSNVDKIIEKESVFDGIISLKTYEGKGFDINIPVIYRKLKKYLESSK